MYTAFRWLGGLISLVCTFAHVILMQQRRHVQPPLGLVAFERFLWLWYYNWKREIGSKLRLINYALGKTGFFFYTAEDTFVWRWLKHTVFGTLFGRLLRNLLRIRNFGFEGIRKPSCSLAHVIWNLSSNDALSQKCCIIIYSTPWKRPYGMRIDRRNKQQTSTWILALQKCCQHVQMFISKPQYHRKLSPMQGWGNLVCIMRLV